MATSSFPLLDNRLELDEKFRFVHSCDIDEAFFKIKVGALEGCLDKSPSNLMFRDEDDTKDIRVTCELLSDNQKHCPSKETSFKQYNGSRWDWNEWITFPIRISDLQKNTIVKFSIWSSKAPGQTVSLGNTCISLFSKHSLLRRGIYDLKLWTTDDSDNLKNGKTSKSDQGYMLNKMKKKYDRKQVMKVEWLDRLTFPEMARIQEKERKSSTELHLSIEFCKFVIDGFDCNVVYFEKEAEYSCHLMPDSDVLLVPDPEILQDNLAESKHHKLSRSARSGLSDRDAKPNPQTRDLLSQIVNYPSTKPLSSEEQDLVWKFRFYLVTQKKALAKFLKCLKWDVSSEAAQAIELLYQWSPMDIEDALELLSPQFQHPSVRRYAVSRLQQAPDDDLLLYLLQLVQALKYEQFNDGDIHVLPESEHDLEFHDPNCDLATFLIKRSCNNETLANYLYWYLMVELEEHKPIEGQLPEDKRQENYKMYFNVMKRFSQKFQTGTPEMKEHRNFLIRQQKFVEELVVLMKEVAREKGDRLKKIDKLQQLISTHKSDDGFTFVSFDPLPLPLDPEIKIKGIIPEKATLFKSALMPSRLTFVTTEELEYVAILKYGDDLRQDQLILQTISLIDKLLRRENLDLKLTPYRVLATSSKHGFVQFIDSLSVADVLKNYNDSIQKFFRSTAPNESGPYGISPDVMDTYVKSCAGYCIITYLLGVGDRHLDNLLLTKNGNLFHIDFGFILGRDPKPFPPPMKLSREMVEGMGGINSEHYQQFRKFCYTAFLHLRRHANLILNLFNLMVDATIPDIALEPDKTVKKVQEKFKLDMSDEEAVGYIQRLIEDSTTAVMSALVEQVHKFAQYWRK